MKIETLEIASAAEAARLDELIAAYQKRQNAPVIPHISLASVFSTLGGHPEGGRIFSYFVELQFQLALLNCDMHEMAKLIGPSDQPPPLANEDAFCRQANLLRANSDYIFRYRAIWDKVMAIIVLLRAPEEFQRFTGSQSKKKAFRKIAKSTGRIPDNFLDHIIETTTAFDEKYRTEEAHGSGSARKFSFSYLLSEPDSAQADMFWAWNALNAVVARFGEAFRSMPQPGAG
jgi:hypothetical protein